MEEKKWYLSKTLYGALILLITTALQVAGVTTISADEQTLIVDRLYGMATIGADLVGIILVIFGRVTAKTGLK